MQELLTIFFTFFRIGLFTFGGGYAMISIIEDDCVEKKKWITHDEMMNIAVIAESTPGPIAINCSTFVGYKRAKLPGAIAGTLGVILPSFIVIFAISLFLDNFLEIEIIAKAFRGISIAVGVLILYAGVTMIRKMPKKTLPMGIALVSFIAMFLINLFALKISSVVLMLAAAVFSLTLCAVTAVKKRGDGK